MPYIKQKDRDGLEYDGDIPRTAGELNYLITTIIDEYYNENGGSYQQANDIVGALEGAKLEFYRKVVAPYEDTKEAENGTVYRNKEGV